MSSVQMEQPAAVPMHASWNQYLEAERDRAPGDYISDWLRQGAAISGEYANLAYVRGAAISSEYANRAYVTSAEYAPVVQDWFGRQAGAGYDAAQHYVPIIGEWTQQQARAGYNAAAQYVCSCQPQNLMETSPTQSDTLPMSPQALAQPLTCFGPHATLPELRSSTPSRGALQDSVHPMSTSAKSGTPVVVSTLEQPAQSLEMPIAIEPPSVDSEDSSDGPVVRQTSAHVMQEPAKSSSTPVSRSMEEQLEMSSTRSSELPSTNPNYDGPVHATSADSVLIMPAPSTSASMSNDGQGVVVPPEKACELPSQDTEVESTGPVHSTTATSVLVMPAPRTPVAVSKVEQSTVNSENASKKSSWDQEGESNGVAHATTENYEHSVSSDGQSAGTSETSNESSSTKPQVHSRRKNIPDAPSPVKQTRCMCFGGK